MPRRALGVLVLLALSVVTPAAVGPAVAEHTSHHRYFFVGTVRTESGLPVCGVVVRAFVADFEGSPDRDRSASTDWSGAYTVQLHMHSGEEAEAQPSDKDKQVVLTVAGTSQTVTVVRNQLNPNGWGQLTIDFTVNDTVESLGLCLRDVAIYAAVVVGGVALAVVGVLVLRRRGRGVRHVRADIMKLPGATRSKARELEGAGIRSLDDLSRADPGELAASTNLTEKQARVLVKRAQDAQKQRDA
ncbi:MAG TPA: helix-hairpin-helix domain-containing protein [Thermoplasmata archaeon]|nr:helix-hairpin-helix domain-containing protein [Thermoplasmata archaeon]